MLLSDVRSEDKLQFVISHSGRVTADYEGEVEVQIGNLLQELTAPKQFYMRTWELVDGTGKKEVSGFLTATMIVSTSMYGPTIGLTLART